jgi:Fe2+ or Zn2+ uptake regulation protein
MEIERVTSDLRQKGFRITPQRLAILRVLEDAGGHLSPGEVFDLVQHRIPGVNEATVYRTLNFLADENAILVAHLGQGRLVYEIGGHHHHLICRECKNTVEVASDSLETLWQHLREETGYQMNSSHMTFFGVCPACQVLNETIDHE